MLPLKRSNPQSLRSVRLAELRTITPEEIRVIVARIRQSHRLPKLARHFDKHQGEFAEIGVLDMHAYRAQLVLHLRNPESRVYSFITTKATPYRMWAIVDVDTGLVAQYNETRDQLWSFYRHLGIADFLAAVSSFWIEVADGARGIELK